jgi:hypothetical protein
LVPIGVLNEKPCPRSLSNIGSWGAEAMTGEAQLSIRIQLAQPVQDPGSTSLSIVKHARAIGNRP